MKNDSAFPNETEVTRGTDGSIYKNGIISGGLTKRELFAAMAMQGLAGADITSDKNWHDRVAECAVLQAEALIKALEAK